MYKYLTPIFLTLLVSCSVQDCDTEEPVFLADPFILEDEGIYYMYGTSHPDGILVMTSADLKNWSYSEKKPLALHKSSSFGNSGFWAPEVYRVGNKYLMYYTAECHICVAESDSPSGPFVQKKQEPMAAGIDNSLFFDSDGTPYIFWVKWDKQYGNEIWSAKLEDDLMHIVPGTEHLCLRKSQEWENRKLDVNEGPFVIKHKDTYYLTYSANCFSSQDYGVGYAVSKSIDGPWEKYGGNPILRSPGDLRGTGHHAIFKDAEGNLKIVFHSHFSKEQVIPRITHITDAGFVANRSGGADILNISEQTVMMTLSPEQPLLHVTSNASFSKKSHVHFMTDFWKNLNDRTNIFLYHDHDRLYFEFDICDTTLQINRSDIERSVDFSDRAEIFLSKDKEMKEYFCFEIDPYGKVMDYKASHYRDFDFEWDCQEIITDASITDTGYCVTASFPLEWLRREGLMAENGDMLVGLYRADFIKGTEADIDWYSWRKPKSSEPDFHIPSSLGRVRVTCHR